MMRYDMIYEVYCLPIMTYSIAELDLKAKQLAELNVCWNYVIDVCLDFTNRSPQQNA